MRIICLFFVYLLFNGCAPKVTCWKIINDEKCVPIKTYKEWNKCVMHCENIKIESKTKPYKPKKWIRPRPYAYP